VENNDIDMHFPVAFIADTAMFCLMRRNQAASDTGRKTMDKAEILQMYQEAANTIRVNIKSVYGEEKIYPACQKAVTFCKMLGQKTLTTANIASIKQLGFQVEVVSTLPATL
jgi:hypothetical protein